MVERQSKVVSRIQLVTEQKIELNIFELQFTLQNVDSPHVLEIFSFSKVVSPCVVLGQESIGDFASNELSDLCWRRIETLSHPP